MESQSKLTVPRRAAMIALIFGGPKIGKSWRRPVLEARTGKTAEADDASAK